MSKYADHLLLDRQAQIYARQGIALDRSTLADWVGHAAWHLRPLHERLLMRLKQLPRLFADETTASVLDPGRGRTKTGRFGPMPPMTVPEAGRIHRVLPISTRPIEKPSGRAPTSRVSREFCRSMAMPATVSWPIAATSGLRSAGRTCGATSTNSPPGPAPIASEALEHSAALYAVEKDVRGRGADERRTVRQQNQNLADVTPSRMRPIAPREQL